MTAVDVIPEKVELINWRKSPIQDEYIEKYLTEKELNLTATLDGAKAYADADFVVIAAPTNYDPVKNYFDTSHVEEVIELMKSVNPCAVMVIKSTIPVGYTESVRRKLDTENVIFSPEFLRESKALGCDSHCRRSSILDDECFLAVSLFLLFLSLKQSKVNVFSKLGEKDSLYIYIFHPLFMTFFSVANKYLSNMWQEMYLYCSPLIVLAATVLFSKTLRILHICE